MGIFDGFLGPSGMQPNVGAPFATSMSMPSAQGTAAPNYGVAVAPFIAPQTGGSIAGPLMIDPGLPGPQLSGQPTTSIPAQPTQPGIASQSTQISPWTAAAQPKSSNPADYPMLAQSPRQRFGIF